MNPPLLDSRAALVVAHPSHELRVHGWLQLVRPQVIVLTDGSGRSGQPRLPSTTRVLSQVGAEPGPIFGRITDLELYGAILSHNYDLFIKLSDELADFLIREEIEYVAGDAAEGYSSAHDICRLVINAAVETVRLKYGGSVSNYDFLVVGSPDESSSSADGEAIWIHLDDDIFSAKVAAAHGYSPKLAADIDAAIKGERFQGIRRFSEPQLAEQVDVELGVKILAALKSYPDLDAKVKEVLGGVELNAFRTECLRPVSDDGVGSGAVTVLPFYEVYGEKLVAAGRYDEVIRYREHILPLADALREHVARSV